MLVKMTAWDSDRPMVGSLAHARDRGEQAERGNKAFRMGGMVWAFIVGILLGFALRYLR